MNTPSPLVPQGTIERQSKGKTVRIAIIVISIHAVFFAGLLMQGCNHDETKGTLKSAEATNSNELPPLDGGYYGGTQELAQAVASTYPVNPPTQPAAEVTSQIPAPMAPEPLPESGKPYTVAKGDTLSRIAKANGVTIGAITRANPSLDPSRLRPGQKIQLPMPSAASAGMAFAEPSKPETASSVTGVYTVKPGETLTRIAKQHGTTVRAIRAANNLKSDRLLVGQKLKMPAPRSASISDRSGTASATVLTATAMR